MIETVTEASRDNYAEWGILNHRGEIVSGQDHPTAMTHSDLWSKVPAKDRHKTVEYILSSKKPELMVRTCSKAGLVNAMKNWRKFPQHETVMHDHIDNIEDVKHFGDTAKPNHALAKMNGLLKEYD